MEQIKTSLASEIIKAKRSILYDIDKSTKKMLDRLGTAGLSGVPMETIRKNLGLPITTDELFMIFDSNLGKEDYRKNLVCIYTKIITKLELKIYLILLYLL